jgi:hypothetical protein
MSSMRMSSTVVNGGNGANVSATCRQRSLLTSCEVVGNLPNGRQRRYRSPTCRQRKTSSRPIVGAIGAVAEMPTRTCRQRAQVGTPDVPASRGASGPSQSNPSKRSASCWRHTHACLPTGRVTALRRQSRRVAPARALQPPSYRTLAPASSRLVHRLTGHVVLCDSRRTLAILASRANAAGQSTPIQGAM